MTSATHPFPRQLVDVPPVLAVACTDHGCPVCRLAWSAHCDCSVEAIETASPFPPASEALYFDGAHVAHIVARDDHRLKLWRDAQTRAAMESFLRRGRR